MSKEKKRLEELRAALRAENISYEELAELQALVPFIDKGDVELLEAAGVPEEDAANIVIRNPRLLADALKNTRELMEDTPRPYDVTGAIIAFESGELDEDATVELFQYLVDTGMAWSLPGSYGRTAMDLIRAGLVVKR